MTSKLSEENKQKEVNNLSDNYLKKIHKLDSNLSNSYSEKIKIETKLNRKFVSFQANKEIAYYRWYKYKEAFSTDLVQYLANKYCQNKGRILDPFAGMGTTLFSCSNLGFDTDGIEVHWMMKCVG